MRLIFYTEHSAEEFSTQNSSLFPEPPQRCPFKDCALPIKAKNTDIIRATLLARRLMGFCT